MGKKKAWIALVLGVGLMSLWPNRPARALELTLLNMTNKKDKTATSVHTFRHRDTIWIFFIASDVAVDEQNRCHLVQSLNILNDQGGVVLTFPKLLVFEDELPPSNNVVTFNNHLELSKLRKDLPPGDYFAVITVHDQVSGEVAALKAKFTVIGGLRGSGEHPTASSHGLRISRVSFRDAPNGPDKSNAVYKSGQVIYVIADVNGYQMDDEGTADIAENLYLLNENNDVLLKKEPLLVFTDKGKEGVPITFTNTITLDNPPPGLYKVLIQVHDRLAGTKTERVAQFTIQ